MQTNRYTRRNRPSGTTDSYDSLSNKYPSHHTQLEYWTNGTVTHLMTSPQAHVASLAGPQGVPRAIPSNNKTVSNNNLVRNSLIAGTFAGITSTCSVYPLDVLRTKMQSAAAAVCVSSTQTKATPLIVSASVHHHHHHRGPLQVFLQTLQHGGIRALYTGMALPLTAQAVYKATVFSVNDITTRALLEWKRQESLKTGMLASSTTLTLGDRFTCGSVGGAVNAFLFVTPVELVRNQLIEQHTRKAHAIVCASTPHYDGPYHVIRHLLATQGIVGLWKGAAMTVLRDSLGCGCFFATFYFVKQRYLPNQDMTSTAMAGAISGFAFWVVALPLDTVKTWVQNGSASSGKDAILHSLSQSGVLGTATRLLRGWQVAFGRGMPAAAVTMTTYEGASNYLDQHF